MATDETLLLSGFSAVPAATTFYIVSVRWLALVNPSLLLKTSLLLTTN